MYFTITGDAHHFQFWGDIATQRETVRRKDGLLKLVQNRLRLLLPRTCRCTGVYLQQVLL